MIEVDHITKRYGNATAVDDISFTVSPGEVLGFLGPNGAGKTTTIKIVSGFLTATSGTVTVFGHDVNRSPIAARRNLGYLPEGAPAYSDMTARSFLGFVAAARGFGGHQGNRLVARAIERLSLQEICHQPIETLSKGFRRRVGIAQAILHDPKALLLDEPTDGLDPNQKHQVRELIRSLANDKLVIVSTHILEEVDAICSRAIIINKGRLIVDKTPEELAALSTYHGAMHLKFTSPTDVDDTRLAALPGVARIVRETDNPGDVILLPEPGADLLTPTSNLVREGGLRITGMFQERGRLDETFRNLTGNTRE